VGEAVPAKDGEHPLFARFWIAYPIKTNRPATAAAFSEIVTDDDTAFVDKIVAAVERQKRSIKWQKNGGEFITYPENWLRQAAWDDVLPEASAPAQPAERVWDKV